MESLYVSVKPEYLLPSSKGRNGAKRDTVESVDPEKSIDDDAPIATESNMSAERNPSTEISTSADVDSSAEITPLAGQKRKSEDTDNGKVKLSLKKRHQETHPDKENRLCSFIGRGEICPYEGTCQYSHDVFEFLSNKPADLGPVCYQFQTFGYCPNGFMCRFGEGHIDREKGLNLKRPVELGGVLERVGLNVLSKPTQQLLRKKQFESVHPVKKERNEEKQKAASKDESKTEDSVNLTAYPSKSFKLVDFSNKVYVAPLTTVGNLPFRRILKEFGADITCGEMAMASNIQNGQASEWALLRKHASEDSFGIQLTGNHPSLMSRVANILEHETQSDFVDLNCGCPIDVVCSRGAGSALMHKPQRLCEIVKVMADNLPSRSITVKVRIGWDEKNPTTHKLMPFLQKTAPGHLAAVMIHGRSRLQRYHKLANWDYILQCAQAQNPELPRVPVIGNGDIFSYDDWRSHQQMLEDNLRGENDGDKEVLGLCSCAMIGRGALIKPWLPQELKEQRVVDISASERLDMLKRFCNYGLEHWGSDQQGVSNTRRFLLEWLSFLHRYVPAGIVENGPQRMSQRPPNYFGRCDLETLLSSSNCVDWIRISEMLLGPVPEGFSFTPKHKSNSYSPEAE